MSIYDSLNPAQKEAVFYTEGPLLILAGAGSGKTRVLTHRIAYLIAEKNVRPINILAITFTNKAAGEMRDRVDALISENSDMVWVSTFHSLCVRILRRFIDLLGYERDFTIYDASDQKETMKKVFRKLDIDPKVYKEKDFLNEISHAKDELISVEQFYINASRDRIYGNEMTARVYEEYQKELKRNNALDFDDLIMKTVELFTKEEDVLSYYQDRFRYVMVDEYQDTNTAQFRLVDMIARKYRNLCVVGDDDQSIYKFRGANIRNILDFEKNYSDAKVIKLEQNYRSSGNILSGANEVIHHNYGRKDKTLWTGKDKGEKIRFQQFPTERDEAEFICDDIESFVAGSVYDYKDFAVLYRTNAQSRVIEERLVLRGIPYKIIGGQNFYGRKEIKDILSYLKTINNGSDDLALKRIINVPKRGIGDTTVNRIEAYAYLKGISMADAIREPEEIGGIGSAASKVEAFYGIISDCREKMTTMSLVELLYYLLDRSGYIEELQEDGSPEAMARIENIDELITKAASYEEDAEEPDLTGFLEEVALVADVDDMKKTDACVVLMTLHSAKGLEFPVVYMTGMEENLFPGYMSISGNDPAELEEERRLCYVGMTRAMERLILTCARSRMVKGTTQFNDVSRFVREIPEDIMKIKGVLESRRENRFLRSFDNISGTYDKAFERYKEYDAFNDEQKRKKEADKDILNIKGVFRGKDLFNRESFGKDKRSEIEENTEDIRKGDRVRHPKFGKGIVTELFEEEITVNFDNFGIRRMKKGYAPLEKL